MGLLSGKVIQYDGFVRSWYGQLNREKSLSGVCDEKKLYDWIVRYSPLEINDHVIEKGTIKIHNAMPDFSVDSVDSFLIFSKFFWIIFLINPLIAARACATCALWNQIDLYTAFKHCTDLAVHAGIYLNQNEDAFLVYCYEAILQQQMPLEELYPQADRCLDYLYQHDRKVMNNNANSAERKWISYYALDHIINRSDRGHLIILLNFFAGKYHNRIRFAENQHEQLDGAKTYSGDRYLYIINSISKRIGSLGEYVNYSDMHYKHFYKHFYSLVHDDPLLRTGIPVVFGEEDNKQLSDRLFLRTL